MQSLEELARARLEEARAAIAPREDQIRQALRAIDGHRSSLERTQLAVLLLAVGLGLGSFAGLAYMLWRDETAWNGESPLLGIAAAASMLIVIPAFLSMGPFIGYFDVRRRLRVSPDPAADLEHTGIAGTAILTRYVRGSRTAVRTTLGGFTYDVAWFAVQASGAPYEVELPVFVELHCRRRVENGVSIIDFPEPGERFAVRVDPRNPRRIWLPFVRA